MPAITFQGTAYAHQAGETVLATLHRHGVKVPSSCREGHCQTCLLRCIKGNLTPAAQTGLKPALRDLNYFLACQCQPESDLDLLLPDSADVYSPAVLVDRAQLAADVWRLRFTTAEPLNYRAGQFISIKGPQNCIRSYSLASQPEAPWFELHVRRRPDGRMSRWLTDDLVVGASIEIGSPNGQCIYTQDAPEQPLLMIATGTGLAPIIGILNNALAAGHEGDIHLFHGVATRPELYQHAMLSCLADAHHNLHYQGCLSADTAIAAELTAPQQAPVNTGRAADIALASLPSLAGWRVYLCGSPDMVKQTRTRAYLAGAAMQDILVDAFTASSDT